MRPLSLLAAACLAVLAGRSIAGAQSDQALEAQPADLPQTQATVSSSASADKAPAQDVKEPSSSKSAPTSAPTPMPPPGTPPYNVDEHKQLDLLQTLNQIEQQKFQEKQQASSERKDEVSLANDLADAQLKAATAAKERELKLIQLDGEIRDEKNKAELAELTAQRDRLQVENDIARAKLDSDQIKADDAKIKIDTALQELDYEDRKAKLDAEMTQNKTVSLETDLELRDKKEEWKKQANHDPDYEAEPFQNGVLTISDRRITLDGPIIEGMADYVTDRINYFNNKDEKLPIFIVIDRSPGGSVMEGYRIVKAIQSSKAPVHVVVKSFAASMAAVIATMAPHSYAYPNAIILHHQLFAFAMGNPTELKDQMREIDQWYQRLAGPVAKKMGLSLDAYTKEMYKHNSDGDWMEFADQARQLKWIDNTVTEIRETGQVKDPDSVPPQPPAPTLLGLREQTDPQGNPYVKLPRLAPGDAYWIDNPDHYYR